MFWRKKNTAEAQDEQAQRRGGRGQRQHAPRQIAEPGVVSLYGDRVNDGAVQLSFTLPVPAGDKAKVVAEMFCEKMNLKDPKVIHMEAMSDSFTFFVVYAVSEAKIDFKKVEVPVLDYPLYTMAQVNELVMKKIGRKIVVLGACIGSDAHTVGIDAIFNMKGYLGDYGLERYSCMEAKNLRAQVWSPIQEAMQIVLPEEAEWREDCINAHAQFPLGSHDDDIDAMGHAIQEARARMGIEIDAKAMADGFGRASEWW